MIKKFIITVTFSFLSFFISTVQVWAKDITVGVDYSSIQIAIDHAGSGDRILVNPGTYNESLSIVSLLVDSSSVGKDNIIIQGKETARTILKASGFTPAITVTNATNITIRNLTIIDSSTGIKATGTSNVRIFNNVFTLGANSVGVDIIDTATAQIINNVFYKSGTAVSGVSDTTEIKNNIFSNNDTAIPSDESSSNIYNNAYYLNKTDGPLGVGYVPNSDPKFVDPDNRDFHLKATSPCIDTGTSGSLDIIDNTANDIGAYGGPFSDVIPFPVSGITADIVAGASPDTYAIDLSWAPNNSYRTGGYIVYYNSGVVGPPFDNQQDGAQATKYQLTDISPSNAKPAAPMLNATTPGNGFLALSWSAVDGATGYKVHYGINSTDENVIDVGNVTSYQLEGLENNTNYKIQVSSYAQTVYYLAVKVYDNTGNPEHISDYSSVQTVPVGTLSESGELSNEVTDFPEAAVVIPNLPDQGCFIEAVSYGYYSDSQIQPLRDFRDTYLKSNKPGRAFVRWYYSSSPKAVAFVNTHVFLKPVIRAAMWPFMVLTGFFTMDSSKFS